MSATRITLAFATLALALPAFAQDVVTLRDLEPMAPTQLSRDELLSLLPGAKMNRTNEKGNTHLWSNDDGGRMVVSSDNRGSMGRSSTAQGTWRISDDGRYCMTINWKKGEAEESCRFILKTTNGYYGVNGLQPDSQKAYRLTITK